MNNNFTIIGLMLLSMSLVGCGDIKEESSAAQTSTIAEESQPIEQQRKYISYDSDFTVSNLHNELAISIYEGDTDKAKTIIQSGIDPNGFGVYDSSRPFPFLVIAANYNRTEVVKLLLEKGADINIVSSVREIKEEPHKTNNYPVIYHAIKSNNIEIAQMIFDQFDKEDIAYQCLNDALSWSVTMNSSSEIVRLLIDKGGDPNYVWDRVTPITEAAENKDEANLKVLLEAGADINALNSHGELIVDQRVIPVPKFTALDYAEILRDDKMANLLRKYGAKTANMIAQ